MQELYLLSHAYEISGHEEIKILGIYTNYQNAEQAKQRYLQQEGFCNFPSHCFVIENYIPDKDCNWSNGFFMTNPEVFQNFQKLSKKLSEFLNLKENWENQEYFNLLQEISWKLSASDNITEIAEFIERMTENFLPNKKPKELYLKFAEVILNL
ncbi:MAG: hypothetical protein HDT22_01850 [Ruminococcus sp.]|nr:hypothetical protein [Ruminococcus sp.]